jgi:manganese/zinc/iron transport system permease protein
MIGLAALFGAASGVSGALISVSEARLPTGPMIILSLTAIVIVSVLFAPNRGVLWDMARRRRQNMDFRLKMWKKGEHEGRPS